MGRDDGDEVDMTDDGHLVLTLLSAARNISGSLCWPGMERRCGGEKNRKDFSFRLQVNR